jgi:omega-6 fatty acid desaturase (delta-12 desaturase)
MGKGKNALVGLQTTSKEVCSLHHLSDAELRKCAKSRGLEDDKSRKELLEILAPYERHILDVNAPKPLPLGPITFTLQDIKLAIPSHCFQRSALRSLSHLALDLVIVFTLGYLATFIDSQNLFSSYFRWTLWPIYWFCQGSVLTGVWVIAHECGHQAFSPFEFLNNFVGWICHSALLVPYHSWKITHGKHHNNTGSCENDEVFSPPSRSDIIKDLVDDSPIICAIKIFLMLTVGWIPGYLVFNTTGPKKYRGKNINHFSPSAVFFTPKDRIGVILSDIGFFLVLSIVIFCCSTYGFLNVVKFYLIPYFIVNYHLVLITYLQHTDNYIPHFRAKEWNWLRGALCTVDRSFGPILDHVFHHITDTHVCHHLFSKMPFYHAQEATEHIKRVIGEFYRKDDTPIAKALWRSYNHCKFVEDDGDIVFYKHST